MNAPRPTFAVSADLRLEVDGTAVGVAADGQRIEVYVADPSTVASAAASAARATGLVRGRRRLARAVDAAIDRGLEIRVTGPEGALVTAGPGIHAPWWVRLLTGSTRLRPGPLGAWWRPARAAAGGRRRRR